MKIQSLRTPFGHWWVGDVWPDKYEVAEIEQTVVGQVGGFVLYDSERRVLGVIQASDFVAIPVREED